MDGGRSMPNPKYLHDGVTCPRGLASPSSGRIFLNSQCIGVGYSAFWSSFFQYDKRILPPISIACCPVILKNNYFDKQPKGGHMLEAILLDQNI